MTSTHVLTFSESDLDGVLDRFQKLQYEHDQLFHPDILALSTGDRMKHVLSHLVKYQYPMLTKEVADEDCRKAVIDSYIMLLSACNILKIRASTELHKEKFDKKILDESFSECFLASMAQLAKACDSADHIEQFPINEVWKKSVLALLILFIRTAENNELDLPKLAKERHREAESKHGLHFILGSEN